MTPTLSAVDANPPLFTPVNVLTGFLGSGKTTLLQRLLRSPALHDTAVLINEFGEVGLDHHLLERLDETTVLLQSGCVCCTIRGDLSKAMRDLHAKRDAGMVPLYRRLVIETTGLADPLPVLTTVTADAVLCHHYRLGNVITTVDAVNGAEQLNRQPESRKQAAVADRLVITKSDLSVPSDTQSLIRRLRALNPAADVLIGKPAQDQAEQLLAHDVFDVAVKTEEVRRWFASALEDGWENERAEGSADHRADGAANATNRAAAQASQDIHEHQVHEHPIQPNRHGDDIESFCLQFDDPLDWTAFGIWLTMLLNRHGNEVLRVKGILNVRGESDPVAVHGVQQLVHPPVHLTRWPDEDRRSRIVFITRGIDAAKVRRSLGAFMTVNLPS